MINSMEITVFRTTNVAVFVLQTKRRFLKNYRCFGFVLILGIVPLHKTLLLC